VSVNASANNGHVNDDSMAAHGDQLSMTCAQSVGAKREHSCELRTVSGRRLFLAVPTFIVAVA
jgi:hypothetical protein